MTILETSRLILRPWEVEDAPELFRYASDPKIGPIAGWLPHVNVAESVFIIEQVFSAPETYAVVLKETGLPVGCVGLLFGENGNVALQSDEAEVGYWIGVPYWGCGYIPEAVQELVRYSFEELGLNKLWLTCNVDNGNSKRVAEKCGFVFDRVEPHVEISLINTVCDEYVAYLSKEAWNATTM